MGGSSLVAIVPDSWDGSSGRLGIGLDTKFFHFEGWRKILGWIFTSDLGLDETYDVVVSNIFIFTPTWGNDPL